MKVTRLGKGFPALTFGFGSTYYINTDGQASGQIPTSNGSNGLYWGENVARITANGSNVLTGPFVNFAAGSNIIFAISSNTLNIASTGGGGGGSIITANGSNSLAAVVNLQAGTGIALGVSGQTITITNAGAGAGGGGSGTGGDELDYVQITSPVNVTATTEATANTIVTGNAVAYDGSTIVLIEFWAPYCTFVPSATRDHLLDLYDGSSSIGFFGLWSYTSSASSQRLAPYASIRLTPSAATHTYSIRGHVSAAGTWVIGAGAGGAAAHPPAFIRITRV